MNNFLKDAVQDYNSWFEPERTALAALIKPRGEDDVFAYSSRVAAYMSARRTGDRDRAMIDKEVLETAIADCEAIGFETEQIFALKKLYEQVAVDDDE